MNVNVNKTRLGGLFFALSRPVVAFGQRQFWGGHPDTFRTLFAWASLSIAFYLVTQPRAFGSHGYELMNVVAPSWLWALAFATHWACVSLVILWSRSVRVLIQLLVNFYGLFIWSMYVVLQDLAFEHSAINASAERVLIIYSVWAILRTGMTRAGDQ